MICVRCGNENHQGARFCRSCRLQLPNIPASLEVQPATPLLAYLRTLKQRVLEGEATAEDLSEGLQKVLDHMERSREDYLARTESSPESLRTDPKRARTVEAMDRFIASVCEMALFLEDGELPHVEEGLHMAEQADITLQESLRSEPGDVVTFRYTTLILPP